MTAPATPLAASVESSNRQRVRRLAWVTLGVVVVTIVMGAVVRATHSGDGCGRSWPACDGTLVLPGTGDTAQLIEFSHRAISGGSLLMMAALAVAVFRTFAAPHPARRATLWSVALLIAEALIGAMIVLYGWVADDRSVARQVSVPLHLVNTFLLTGSMALTIWLISGREMPQPHAHPALTRRLSALAAVLLIIAATGATTSLADTLFAAESLAEGLRQDFAAESEFIVRLRVLHPVLAITGGLLLAWFARSQLDEAERRGIPWPAWILMLGVAGQAALGFIHIALLTPLATALLHLTIAQVLWLALVFLALTLLEPQVGVESSREVAR